MFQLFAEQKYQIQKQEDELGHKIGKYLYIGQNGHVTIYVYCVASCCRCICFFMTMCQNLNNKKFQQKSLDKWLNNKTGKLTKRQTKGNQMNKFKLKYLPEPELVEGAYTSLHS